MIKLFTKKRKGFTLIELIVVIAILGILAAIAVPRFTGARADAETKADLATARTIASAVALYEANTGNAKPALTDLIPNYLNETPKTAKSGNAAATIAYDASGKLSVTIGGVTITP